MLLDDEERMKVWIPCEEKCGFLMPSFTPECMDCFAVVHEKAQLKKVVEFLIPYSESVMGYKVTTSYDDASPDMEAKIGHIRINLSVYDWQSLLDEVKDV